MSHSITGRTAAALLMSATRGMLRSLAQTGSGPAEVLTRLNNMMVADFPSGRFVTMVYAEFDPSTRTLRLANAGHLSPLLVEPDSHRWIATEYGLPLGIATSKYSETEIVLSKHARLAIYSDGITEAARGDDDASGHSLQHSQRKSVPCGPVNVRRCLGETAQRIASLEPSRDV